MLKKGDSVLVAVSGGPDSVALLMCLRHLAAEYRLRLHVFHLNHRLRGTAISDEEFVRCLADRLRIPATIISVDVGKYCRQQKYSLQAGAREIRYRLLDETAENMGAEKIATGHNADDVVETFFMRLLKGSGLPGLTGIPPVRQGRIIRPLIETRRSEIIDFLTKEGIEYIIDETNFSEKYLRNRVRNRVIPVLTVVNPNLTDAVLHTTELLRAEESYLEFQAVKEFERLAVCRQGEIYFDAVGLKLIDAAVGYRIIRLAIKRLDDSAHIDSRQLKTVWDLIVSGNLRRRDLASRISVCQEGERVVLFLHAEPLKSVELQAGERMMILPDLFLEVKVENRNRAPVIGSSSTAYTDFNKILWPLWARSYEPGDRFVPLGMKDKKKVHDYFIDEKVPKRLRRRIPLVVDQKQIVWIAGHRLDDRVKVTDETTKVAIIKLIKREYKKCGF